MRAQAGRALRACHEALTSFHGELPRWGVLDEAHDALEKLAATGALAAPEAGLLRQRGRAAASARSRRWRSSCKRCTAMRISATSSTARTVRCGTTGRTASSARAGWDLACMQLHPRVFGRNRASATEAHVAYEPDLDDATLELLMDARHFQATVWFGVVAGRGNERFERLLANYRLA